MSDLFAPVCSIAPTRRRRFFWAAWWTAAPTRDPFRRPDASSGGARTREEALRCAERVAGQRLVAIEARWARAWARVLAGDAPWTDAGGADEVGPRPSPRVAAQPSAAAILGVEPTATIDEIKRAFRKRALEAHPDHGGDPAAFRALHHAYEQTLARRAKPKRRRR